MSVLSRDSWARATTATPSGLQVHSPCRLPYSPLWLQSGRNTPGYHINLPGGSLEGAPGQSVPEVGGAVSRPRKCRQNHGVCPLPSAQLPRATAPCVPQHRVPECLGWASPASRRCCLPPAHFLLVCPSCGPGHRPTVSVSPPPCRPSASTISRQPLCRYYLPATQSNHLPPTCASCRA